MFDNINFALFWRVLFLEANELAERRTREELNRREIEDNLLAAVPFHQVIKFLSEVLNLLLVKNFRIVLNVTTVTEPDSVNEIRWGVLIRRLRKARGIIRKSNVKNPILPPARQVRKITPIRVSLLAVAWQDYGRRGPLPPR